MSASPRPYLNLSPNHAIIAERIYQDEKWGYDRSHTWAEWSLILADEVGEASRVMKSLHFDGELMSWENNLRSELIQVAAVAVAMIEQLDRDRSALYATYT